MLRPPSATELLLSLNGDQLLEGTITNFFVVRLKVRSIHVGMESLFYCHVGFHMLICNIVCLVILPNLNYGHKASKYDLV